MVAANSINEVTTGISGFTGTAFVGTAATQYAVLVGGSTSSTLSNVGPTSTAGQVLQSAGNAANPAFSTATYPLTNAQGDLLYGSAANTITGLTKDTNSTRYLSNQGTSNNPSWNQVNVANGVTGTLPLANGGTGNALGVPTGWTLITTTSITNVATIAFTSASITNYNQIMFTIANGVNGSSSLWTLGYSTDGGSSYAVVSNTFQSPSSATPFGASSAAQNFIMFGAGQTTQMKIANIVIDNSNITENRYYQLYETDTVSNNGYQFGYGVINSSAQINAFRFGQSSGNFTSGTIKMYGR